MRAPKQSIASPVREAPATAEINRRARRAAEEFLRLYARP